MYHTIGSIPVHQYVFVDSSFTHHQPSGFTPAIWFGLVSMPGRVWGCNVLLECGAVYRNIPLHALSFHQDFQAPWGEKDAQSWDCYSSQFSVHEYSLLRSMRCTAVVGDEKFNGEYLFTVAPIECGYDRCPEQNKEFVFAKLDNGRLVAKPTNEIYFTDKSFTSTKGKPRGLKLQKSIWRCE